MTIDKYCMGPLGTNCYILKEDGKALVIDPSGKGEKIAELLEGNDLIAVLLTHGHFDHIKGVDYLAKQFQVPVYLNNKDWDLATSLEIDKENQYQFGFSARISVELNDICEGQHTIGPFTFQVYETPGHTMGGLCFLFDKDMFCGDTIFKESIGRVDLAGADARLMKDSLRFIKTLDPDYVLYPGHGDNSTIAYELENNYYLRRV